jgi:AcrR family transcriptional regulator
MSTTTGWTGRTFMAHARTPRRAWIDQGLQALAAGGPDAVRVESLAKALGVSKGGFYWYFADRAALLEEMLDTFEREGVDAVIDLVESRGGDARAKLKRLFTIAVIDAVPELMAIEFAVRDWARREAAAAARLQRVDSRRMDYMRSLFRDFCPEEDDVEVRCTLLGALFIANHLITADHGPRSHADVLNLALTQLLS